METKKRALSIIASGLAVSGIAFVANAVLAPESARFAQMFGLAITLGHVIFVVGCIQLARAKNRPWYYGLLGLFSCLGLAVLWFAVPDAKAETA